MRHWFKPGQEIKEALNDRISQRIRDRSLGRFAHLFNEKTTSRYGLSAFEASELLEHQGGNCPVCLKAITIDPVLDHDHEQGPAYVRGVLHRSCNASLGHFGDTKAGMLRRLAAVRTYLETGCDRTREVVLQARMRAGADGRNRRWTTRLAVCLANELWRWREREEAIDLFGADASSVEHTQAAVDGVIEKDGPAESFKNRLADYRALKLRILEKYG